MRRSPLSVHKLDRHGTKGPSPENVERRGASLVVTGKPIEQRSNGVYEIAAPDPEERNRERRSTFFFAPLPLPPQSILMPFSKHKPCRWIRHAKSMGYDDRPTLAINYDGINRHN